MEDSLQTIVQKMETSAKDARLSLRIALGVGGVIVLILLAAFGGAISVVWAKALAIAPLYFAACIVIVDGIGAYRLLRYLNTYASLCRAFKDERRAGMHAVSMRMGVSVYTLTNMVFALIREDILPAACFDAVRKEFVLSGDAAPSPRALAQNAALMDSDRQPTLMPYGLAVLCFVGCAAYLGFHGVLVPLIVAAVFFLKIRKSFIPVRYFHETLNLSLGTEASLADKIGPAIGRIASEEPAGMTDPGFPSPPPAAETELEMLRDDLLRLSGCIENLSVRDAARMIGDAVADICDFSRGGMEAAGDVRGLTHRYLPMCVKLLSDYSVMEVYRHKGRRVREVMHEIEESMSQIAAAVVRELDQARVHRLMGTSVELAVLKTLLGAGGGPEGPLIDSEDPGKAEGFRAHPDRENPP